MLLSDIGERGTGERAWGQTIEGVTKMRKSLQTWEAQTMGGIRPISRTIPLILKLLYGYILDFVLYNYNDSNLTVQGMLKKSPER